MGTQTKRPIRADSPRKLAKASSRDKIVASAKTCFQTLGYERAVIRDIAHTAGMSTGAVFSNFSGKADLYQEVYGHPPVSPEAARDLLAALQEASATFRRYACLHDDKGTPEGREKAAANRAEAERCEAAIAQAKAA